MAALRRWNLNLLPVLRELIRTRNVTRAGESLGLGQPATSAALSRLRDLLGDELLVMVGREMHLTAKARAIGEPLERLLAELESLLGLEVFEPRTSKRKFVIATADYVGLVVGGPLLRRFQAQAPEATVQIIDIPLGVNDKLRTGEIDLLISPDIGLSLAPRICRAPLLRDRLVCVVAENNPQVGETLDLATYQRLPHVKFQLNLESQISAEHQLLEKTGIRQKDVMSVPNFLLLPLLIEESGCIALVHAALAARLAGAAKVRIFDPPFEAAPVDIDMFWGLGQDLDAAHLWLRRQVEEAAAERRTIPD